jgi:hypothetical protein
MSLNNQTGSEGNGFEFYAKNKVTVVGGGCVNLSPCTRIDNRAKSLQKFKLSSNTGTIPYRGSMPSATMIDTSITHPIGTWSLCVGNKWDITVGTGGIRLTNTGPLMSTSPYVVFFGEEQLNLHSGTIVEIKSGRTISLDAPQIVINASKEMVMQSSLCTNANIVANGGFFARGETFITHMTVQSQMMETKECTDCEMFINPTQSFAVAAGNSTFAQLKLGTTYSGALASASGSLPNQSGLVDVVIALWLPSPFDKVLTVPAKIGFPLGIRLISDGLYGSDPASTETTWITKPTPEHGLKSHDASGGAHSHMYTAPAATYVKDTEELYSAAKDSDVMSNKPIGHEPVSQGGMQDWIKNYINKQKKAVTDSIKKRFKSWFTPTE